MILRVGGTESYVTRCSGVMIAALQHVPVLLGGYLRRHEQSSREFAAFDEIAYFGDCSWMGCFRVAASHGMGRQRRAEKYTSNHNARVGVVETIQSEDPVHQGGGFDRERSKKR